MFNQRRKHFARSWKKQYPERTYRDQNAKVKEYLFGTGSSLDWAIARNKIQTAFQAAGVWEYVNCPQALIPVAPVGGGPIVFPELTLPQQ